MLSGYAVKTTAIVTLYLYMYLENKRRDRAALEGTDSEGDGVENGMLVSMTPSSDAGIASLAANTFFLGSN
jgi:hypothetical protein